MKFEYADLYWSLKQPLCLIRDAVEEYFILEDPQLVKIMPYFFAGHRMVRDLEYINVEDDRQNFSV